MISNNEKNKKLKLSEDNQKKLAKRIAELEESLENHVKSADNQTMVKTKEAKKAVEDLKNSENRVKDLLKVISEKNKKISELENNAILKPIKEQVKDVIRIDDKMTVAYPTNKENRVQCRYENTGVCRNKTNCVDVHPRKTCQAHSKLVSCSTEALCEHRHPFGICFDYQNFGFCQNGDNCRNQHPFELARRNNHTLSFEQDVIGQGQAGTDQRLGGGPDQVQWSGGANPPWVSQWSPSQGHGASHWFPSRGSFRNQRMGSW